MLLLAAQPVLWQVTFDLTPGILGVDAQILLGSFGSQGVNPTKKLVCLFVGWLVD
jgi:hypothetical protein